MSTQEVASKLVAYCRQGQHEEAMKDLYSKDIVSIEPKGAPVEEIRGIEAVIQKSKQFGEMVETMHGMEVSDPCVAENFFSCSMKMDVTYKGAPRMTMEEICLYQVSDGKIIREEFFYTPMPS
ncbi:SnoaL-like domain-containing protein [Lutimonas sp.]|uniref:SnoaL-like domain-containing protein n=1 Tax=Lutimonas sp. TaxID=1872403 RepID=UPI003D9BCF0E